MTAIPQPTIVVREMDDWQSRAAFVIQVRQGAEIGPGRLEGRVEHIASYKAARFHSVDELVAFIVGVLTQVQQENRP